MCYTSSFRPMPMKNRIECNQLIIYKKRADLELRTVIIYFAKSSAREVIDGAYVN